MLGYTLRCGNQQQAQLWCNTSHTQQKGFLGFVPRIKIPSLLQEPNCCVSKVRRTLKTQQLRAHLSETFNELPQVSHQVRTAQLMVSVRPLYQHLPYERVESLFLHFFQCGHEIILYIDYWDFSHLWTFINTEKMLTTSQGIIIIWEKRETYWK